MPDLYETLGVAADATPAEIKKAGRKRQKQTHPDAGGDRNEFESVQRALTILLDPDKRAYYDRTGEAQEGSPEALERAEAHALLVAMMDAAMGDGDPRYVDLAKGVMIELRNVRTKFFTEKANGVSQATKQLTRLEGFAKRLKKKGKGESAMAAVMAGKIAEQKRNKATFEATMDRRLRIVEMAIAMAEGHESKVDGPPPPTNLDPYEEMRRATQRGFFADLGFGPGRGSGWR